MSAEGNRCNTSIPKTIKTTLLDLKADLYSTNVTLANGFFNLHLRGMKCSAYLTRLIFLLTRSSQNVLDKTCDQVP